MSRFQPRDLTRSVGVSHSGHRSLFGSTEWKNIVAKTIRAMKIVLKMIRKSSPSDIRHLATLRRVTRSSAGRRRLRGSAELFQLPLDIAPKLDICNTVFDTLDDYFGTRDDRRAFEGDRRNALTRAIVLEENLAGMSAGD